METELLNRLVSWAHDNQTLAWSLVPLLAFLETCVGVGIFVSSIILVTICSALFATGAMGGSEGLVGMALLAMLGSSLADHVGYYLGRHFAPRVHHATVIQRHQKRWGQAEALVRRFGGGAILMGRFLPAIRSVIPAVVGVSGFPRLKYTAFDFLACSLWAMALAAIVLSSREWLAN